MLARVRDTIDVQFDHIVGAIVVGVIAALVMLFG